MASKENRLAYFTHDTDMRNDIKVRGLRKRFGNDGYAVWCYLLEILTNETNLCIDIETNAPLLAEDFDVSEEKFRNIIEYCVQVGLLQRDGDYIYSSNHQERLEEYIKKSEDISKKRSEAAKKRWENNTNENDANADDSIMQNMQMQCKSMQTEILHNANDANDANAHKNNKEELKKDAASKEASSKEKNLPFCGTDVPLSPSVGEGDALFSFPAVSSEFEIENSQGGDDSINYNELIKFWNEQTKGVYGRLSCIKNKRRAMTRARIREYGKENFAKAIENAARSDFLRGATWFNYDWLICPNNFVKVLENRYTQNGNTNTSTNTHTNAKSGFDIERAIRDGFGLAAADLARGGG